MRPLLVSLVIFAVAAIVWRSLPASTVTRGLPRTGAPVSAAIDVSHMRAASSQTPSVLPTPLTSAVPSPPAGEAEDRVALARARHGESIVRRCADAGLAYPPRSLFLRAFKQEGEIEAWGRDGSAEMKLIATYSLTARSGTAGPKRRQGDRQIPEGCYHVVVFNPKSLFHLSLGLDYPNAADRVHSDPENPGNDIYIHGSDRSVGCLAIGDEMIEELYLLASDVHASRKVDIPVHIFPVRMEGATWDEFRAQHPEYVDFWAQLEPIYTAFETSHRLRNVRVSEAGAYELAK